ncbi:conserved hypothetical protein [Parafrankia sp. EAN1pec]|uniref:hypothetical protein n=1 Tax=Parafrankia sp. (strain EAN1pec) TaxID=298653 RepID=UPI00015D9F5B|nr:conserved hypothetical protein [Frankia sp. EAN1pec]
MGGRPLTLDQAVELSRTGDVWVFRGRSPADRAIQMTTNSPVNHVGMAVVLDDLPPLMWHAELGRSLRDVWSGSHHRGVQLHDLREAVVVWGARYGQRAWLRQLEPTAGREAEDAVLRTVARLDGTPFPSTARLATRWLGGRLPAPRTFRRRRARTGPDSAPAAGPEPAAGAESGAGVETGGGLESAYCAEVVALTYEAMGLLEPGRRPNWYDPGRFWSGDDLRLAGGHRLGVEIAVELPAPPSRG